MLQHAILQLGNISKAVLYAAFLSQHGKPCQILLLLLLDGLIITRFCDKRLTTLH